ncbi:N-acetylmuramoyl-L-alanine amidase [Actibacterium sp. XHP0104]|uniref:N-acetylmuramoyl-L-alanine amidase n=1 Tax=Actibacterium sp. XHP0104 TaxID=2984335 RepID=UPI0021E7A168|nr:N-acetylmuramoyl-L-alanine amidase [Actibacterium sp. XHP0104]MCV2880812.1 N-acetylmuramoyl-L-alanine amidase [Actibacterium sp. XHP0104]
MIRLAAIGAALWLALAGGAAAQDLSALARVDAGASAVMDAGEGVDLTLTLSQPVPYAIRLLDQPVRLVVDFREVDWAGFDGAVFDRSDRVTGVRTGPVRPGWSRMVIELDQPLGLRRAELSRDADSGRGVLTLRLEPVTPEVFAAQVTVAQSALWGLPEPVRMDPPHRRQDGSRPVRVVLDPGHGGIDPGAERDGVIEADLMLTFARELRDELRRAGFEVVLTREDDSFVPLEARVSIARAAGADVFLSLHADIVTEGRASGATIYTLADSASDRASELLAERHDRADLLAGVDLSHQDDVIAGVLMDLARTEAAPRSQALAQALVAGLKQHIGRMHKRPHQEAGFSVLKAPDIPSVLVEIGFMSSPRDLENLTDAEWRAKAAQGIRAALQDWAQSDAAQGALLRQ